MGLMAHTQDVQRQIRILTGKQLEVLKLLVINATLILDNAKLYTDEHYERLL